MPTEPSDVERAIQNLREERDAIDARIRELERKPEELGHQFYRYVKEQRTIIRLGECARCGCWEGSLDSVRPCRGE